MSNRLATRIGLVPVEERASDTHDVVRFHEPAIGSLSRSKGSLFLLAQVTAGDRALERAATQALEAIERDYYYDLSVGTLGALAKALAAANRRLFHARRSLGIPRRGAVSVIAVVVRGRDAHVAKLGPAAAVIVRQGRMYELPPPPAVREQDPRHRERRVAATLGEALAIEPYTWQGELVSADRLALVSRNLAQVVGIEELKAALAGLRPAAAAEHLHQLFAIRGGRGSDGLLVIEIEEVPATATTRQLEPVRPAEPLAGLPDQSPVPLADALGAFFGRVAKAIDHAQAAIARGVLVLMSWILAFVPRRRVEYPRRVARTALREEGRRRRLGALAMVGVALLTAIGVTVASLPSARPTDAIPRLEVARAAIQQAEAAMARVEHRVDGQDLVARAPDRAKGLLNDAFLALQRAAAAGVSDQALEPLRARVEGRLDAVYRVVRLRDVATVVDLASGFDGVQPARMVTARDVTLWIVDDGRGRVIRVDPGRRTARTVYRAGERLDRGTAAAPWLIATAATDVVVIDRQRQAWRIDLVQQVPHRMVLAGVDAVSDRTSLLAALQHRPPLQIFNLYLVDGRDGSVRKWTPPAVIPVQFPQPPQSYLSARPDLSAADARDLIVDANLWLLQSRTMTRVNFGTPLPQAEYSLDPPPDGDVRPRLDYRLVDAASIGDRDLFFVYDAANGRILAFQRGDGAFVKQWLAPRTGPEAELLGSVHGLSVASVPDGPPVALLLAGSRIVRIVLE
ncbi:MAG: hypothetical protein DLM71_01095 [Chloroflexi bacterium]|nr:MAG: hypothetical protein DLM71_01095 [Chloroflexota bacterium]